MWYLINTVSRLMFLFKLILMFYFTFPIRSSQVSQTSQNNNIHSKIENKKLTESMFKAAFIQTRIHQIDAIKSVLKFQDYEKQFKITNKALEKIYEVIVDSKAIVENSNYIPGLLLPTNITVSEALGKIIDNTAMFGEFRLKLPEITERILKSHQEWNVLMQWAIGFSNSTGMFDDKTVQMIDLLCQEMNLIPRDENFINPYRKYDNKMSKETASSPSTLKPKKPKIKKGPRMTKMRTEL